MVVTHGPLPAAGAGPAGALTIGNFDGVHLGHRALLEQAVGAGRRMGLRSTVLTFEPHPREFFAGRTGGEAPARLTRLRDKLELMAQAGIERVHVARFDERLASMPAQAFVEDVLVGGLRTRWLVVGRDFRYGRGRSGDFAALEAAGQTAGFEVSAMEEIRAGGERVSSSLVRAAVAQGDFARAQTLLGRPYSLSGRVVHGAGLGRELGFATANIALRRSPPLSGIYVVTAQVEEEQGRALPGAASVGLRPTVNPTPRPLLEVHLLDFDRDLYGKHLRVTFLAKLREERKFADLPQLKTAIADDVRLARDYFRKHG